MTWSIALRDIPTPDYADATIGVLPDEAPVSPRFWAERIFSVRTMPRWIAAALALRQLLVPLLGIPRAPRSAFAVVEEAGGEALIALDDRHLDFRVGVAVDADARLVRVTTAVRLKGRRGRLYFAPVRLAHPLVVHAMLTRAQRDLSRTARSPRRIRRARAQRAQSGRFSHAKR